MLATALPSRPMGAEFGVDFCEKQDLIGCKLDLQPLHSVITYLLRKVEDQSQWIAHGQVTAQRLQVRLEASEKRTVVNEKQMEAMAWRISALEAQVQRMSEAQAQAEEQRVADVAGARRGVHDVLRLLGGHPLTDAVADAEAERQATTARDTTIPQVMRLIRETAVGHQHQAADAERDRSKVEGFHSVLENVRANEDYLMKRVQEFQTEFKIVEGNLNEKAALALQSAEGLRAWQDDVAAQMAQLRNGLRQKETDESLSFMKDLVVQHAQQLEALQQSGGGVALEAEGGGGGGGGDPGDVQLQMLSLRQEMSWRLDAVADKVNSILRLLALYEAQQPKDPPAAGADPSGNALLRKIKCLSCDQDLPTDTASGRAGLEPVAVSPFSPHLSLRTPPKRPPGKGLGSTTGSSSAGLSTSGGGEPPPTRGPHPLHPTLPPKTLAPRPGTAGASPKGPRGPGPWRPAADGGPPGTPASIGGPGTDRELEFDAAVAGTVLPDIRGAAGGEAGEALGPAPPPAEARRTVYIPTAANPPAMHSPRPPST